VTFCSYVNRILADVLLESAVTETTIESGLVIDTSQKTYIDIVAPSTEWKTY